MTAEKRNLRPNCLLTKVAEMAQQHPGLQNQNLCKVHQEPLFCEADQSPICVVCRKSREHRLHSVVPIEKAVQEYMLKLEKDLGSLQEEMAKTEELQARQEEAMAKWQAGETPKPVRCSLISGPSQKVVTEQRQRILAEFEKMAVFLVEEEQRLLQVLKEEEEETAAKLRGHSAALDQQHHSLEKLLLQLEDRTEREPPEMLQGHGDSETSIHWRRDSLSVQYPEAIPTVLRTVCRVPGQIEVLKNFQEDVVPDPTAAYPLLLYESCLRQYLSALLDSVPQSKDRFLAYPCTVGRETFSSGRHYWEVGMSLTGDALWALGMCRDNVSWRDRIPKSPENGFWVVPLCKGQKYMPSTIVPTPITLSEPPSHVGIFLDFEAGEVSFYNVKDGAHLHTYSQAAFSGPLQLFFCLRAPKSGQMVICTVTLWVKG
ncbi:hypothetical protein MC885_009346 [Smutsia gigantea]|nr:hypothetical protein MC885_009346 [Smutsia gigantea]